MAGSIAGAAVATQERPAIGAGDPFDRDKFLLHQKHLSIDQKYAVFDESGRQILFVKRRSHLGRSLLAALAAIATGAALFALTMFLTYFLDTQLGASDAIQIAVFGIGLLATFIAMFAVGIALGPKRHIQFCTDPQYQRTCLTVLQDKKFMPVNVTFTAADSDLNLLGWFRKNSFSNIIRKRWYVHGPDGELICICMEDSILKSILRRVFRSVLDVPFMRTNFILLAPDMKTRLGEFNRRFTVFDKYVLDMSPDARRRLDRRMAMALGVLLDTAERR